MNYLKLAENLVGRAQKSGAVQAEVLVQIGRSADVRVRDGAIEDLTQATSKGAGVRVVVGDRLGFAFTSDFGETALTQVVDKAIALAQVSAPNPHNALPTKQSLGTRPELGSLFDPQIANLPPDWKIRTALDLEKVVKAADRRIKTLESVGAGESVGDVFLASSEGVSGGYQSSFAYLFASPVAEADGQLQTSSWYDYRRFLSELDDAQTVGSEAARRAVRMLGARKVRSQEVPVVFDPTMAAGFVASLAGACNGDSVFKKASFFAGKLGQTVAPAHVSLVDDGTMHKGLGTAPFDGEGVSTRRTPLIDKGVLRNYLYDTFTAHKANAQSTGNASRGYRSLPGIGTHNLMLEPGKQPAASLLKGISQGLYVTAMLGHGVNLVTGEYSRGANGLWIENGELTYPVQEVTVGGQVLDMLQRLDAVGDDLTFRGSTGAPTIRFDRLTVSGS
jgi:PmbA protein